ncbi:MAG: hypothetical protein Q4P07_07140 [Ornithinimicrobium sp.]|uniref:hypothetical protein n=1 Tax=Ornithinimicrobium sp. TaxID=1977084 RepID=UPI0026DF38EC|nr:hypothetical protein [Ornithinimicrobium sp.]MDO5739909.1 hypothetical protein [Ornithinimicrobium sp.]
MNRVGDLTSRQRIERRQRVGRSLADQHAGVARRADLLAEGLTDHDVRAEITRGVWRKAGAHTICVDGPEPSGTGLLWRALWESGPRAVLDGPSALIAAGLQHWTQDVVHLSVPHNATVRELPGVVHHRSRGIGPIVSTGLRRTKPQVAVIRAAEWAVSDRAAATLVAMTVQQRLVAPAQVMERWSQTARSRRRQLLDAVIRDVCDGAHSINELDIATACRARGLPPPTSQAVRTGSRGRVYLDLFWDDYLVHVEIQGAHHLQGLKGVEDALRTNDVAIADHDVTSLQVPILGWRLRPTDFLGQIEAALVGRGWRRASA